MTRQIIGIKYIKRTSDSCPSQWEVKLMDGRMVYVRYRWGVLSIKVSPKKTDDIMDAVNGREILGGQLGAGFNGFLDGNTMRQYLRVALETLANEM